MPDCIITNVFAIRDFIRTADDGTQTLVRLVNSNPERCYPPGIPASDEWYRVTWQIQGLQPRVDRTTGDPVSTHGIVTLCTENFDPLSAMLFAVYSIRTYLENSPEGRAGRLKWKDVPDDPTWGLPMFQPPPFGPYPYPTQPSSQPLSNPGP